MGRVRGPLLIPVRSVAKRGLGLQSLAYFKMMTIVSWHDYDGWLGLPVELKPSMSSVFHGFELECEDILPCSCLPPVNVVAG